MARHKNNNGYTITETLIVLGVTSVVFATTVALISGQIARYRFRDSVNTANQIIMDALNDVQTGYFDPAGTALPAACTSDGGVGTSDCTFAGKRVDITTGGEIARTNLWVQQDDIPNVVNDLDDAGIATSSQLPAGVDYKNDLSFYVLFKNYAASDVTAGGGQAYEVRYASGNSLVAEADEGVCITDGTRSARIIIGTNGSMTTKVDYEATCP